MRSLARPRVRADVWRWCALFESTGEVVPEQAGQRSGMSTKVPYLSRLGIYRISNEKQETLLKLVVLTTAAVLCKAGDSLT